MPTRDPMRLSNSLPVLIALFLPAASEELAQAAGRVQLDLVRDARASLMASQQWAAALGKAGIRGVRIRSATAGDEVGIAVRGSKESPLYVVTGIVKSSDELVLPPGKFKRRDAARLAQWVEDLAKFGLSGGQPAKSAFGLSRDQFERLHQELSKPVDFSTRGQPRGNVVERIAGRLSLPVRVDRKMAKMLAADEVGEELSGLSCGTVLAYVLRPAGLCFVPRQVGRGIECVVVKAQPGLEIWPVGWKPQKPRPKVLPALFEFRNVNVQGVSAARALEAIGKRLKVPVLIDHNALARHGIEPDKTIVSHPQSRTTYSLALRKILFQARLKYEVRVDEAGKPYLWVSTIKPV